MEERLRQLTLASPWMMAALRAARGLELTSWCIGAGAVRNLVWDALHQHSTPSALADIDLAYFNAADLSPARDAQLQARVTAALPQLSWEVTNQAAVHHWFEDYFGHAVTPLLSLEAAVASWPEYATAVGLCLRADDTIDVIAPYGLDDLFNCVVRRNPARVSLHTYRQRVAQKNYPARWPRVTILDE